MREKVSEVRKSWNGETNDGNSDLHHRTVGKEEVVLDDGASKVAGERSPVDEVDTCGGEDGQSRNSSQEERCVPPIVTRSF